MAGFSNRTLRVLDEDLSIRDLRQPFGLPKSMPSDRTG
jgi:hypothetical protein